VDIAEAVGVHTSTVSRVLNGDPAQSVRPEVYEKIWRTARQQGYRPNALARALKRRRTGALAFVIPLLRNPIWVRLQRASERGYVVMIMEEPGDAPQPPASYRYLLAGLGSAAVDALITRIDQGPAGDVMIRGPMSLVLRQSVGRPASDSAHGRGR
jgi:LacI family transcriptional regulator